MVSFIYAGATQLNNLSLEIKDLQDTVACNANIMQSLLDKIHGRILVHYLSISLIYLLLTVYSITKTYVANDCPDS